MFYAAKLQITITRMRREDDYWRSRKDGKVKIKGVFKQLDLANGLPRATYRHIGKHYRCILREDYDEEYDSDWKGRRLFDTYADVIESFHHGLKYGELGLDEGMGKCDIGRAPHIRVMANKPIGRGCLVPIFFLESTVDYCQ